MIIENMHTYNARINDSMSNGTAIVPDDSDLARMLIAFKGTNYGLGWYPGSETPFELELVAGIEDEGDVGASCFIEFDINGKLIEWTVWNEDVPVRQHPHIM